MSSVVISGCGSGLGKALYESASNKHVVFPHYRKGDFGLTGDITDVRFLDKFTEYLHEANADVFINNAGVYCGGPLEDTSDRLIEDTITTNLTCQILLIKRAYQFFKEQGQGLIINVNSLSGIYPSKNESIYSATKFALKGFSKSLQLEAIGTGVEIIDVYPGAIQTRMTESRPNYDSLMRADEVAEEIINLISNKKHYVNELILRKRNESSNS